MHHEWDSCVLSASAVLKSPLGIPGPASTVLKLLFWPRKLKCLLLSMPARLVGRKGERCRCLSSSGRWSVFHHSSYDKPAVRQKSMSVHSVCEGVWVKGLKGQAGCVYDGNIRSLVFLMTVNFLATNYRWRTKMLIDRLMEKSLGSALYFCTFSYNTLQNIVLFLDLFLFFCLVFLRTCMQFNCKRIWPAAVHETLSNGLCVFVSV